MSEADLLCFSHLRWNFVFQRPNHLMVRCAQKRRVFFVEEPVFESSEPRLNVTTVANNVTRLVPHLPAGLAPDVVEQMLAQQLVALCKRLHIGHALHWYYSPMFWPVGQKLPRELVVYDCMDELSGFLGAPPALLAREQELLRHTDLMFTGGMALYEAKRARHPNVHGVPSSVDVPFFARARSIEDDPADQAHVPSPRLGYFGVIDERIDLALIAHLADARPDWHIVMLGPVVKIDPASLPRRPNIHYLGQKHYDELPQYVAGWDVALMPFALNDATRFISPTKTPEYLAAGLPVVSTAIRDVVEPYERLGLVRIARSPEEFVQHAGRGLAGERVASDEERDDFLAQHSWDATWERMDTLIQQALERRRAEPASQQAAETRASAAE
jgi:glycosyltransferase involved in cell wall biosynthesis